jgi:hypothetical protein
MPPSRTVIEFDQRAGAPDGGPSDFPFEQLRFNTPKSAKDSESRDGGEVSKVCVAAAVVAPGAGTLSLLLRGCQVVKVVRGRHSAHTLYVRDVDRSGVTEFIAALDAHVLTVAKASTEPWFAHRLDEDLVEEYYRNSLTTLHGHGTVARFLMDDGKGTETLCAAVAEALGDVGDDEDHGAAAAASGIDVELRLAGIQFRPQTFACMWTVKKAKRAMPAAEPVAPVEPAAEPVAPVEPVGEPVAPVEPVGEPVAPVEPVAEPVAPVKRKKGAKVLQEEYAFVPVPEAAEAEAEAEEEDDGYVGPSNQQRSQLRKRLMKRLLNLGDEDSSGAGSSGRIDCMRDEMIRQLYLADPEDLTVIADIDQRLDAL